MLVSVQLLPGNTITNLGLIVLEGSKPCLDTNLQQDSLVLKLEDMSTRKSPIVIFRLHKQESG